MKTIELDHILKALYAWESAAKANEDAANAARVERDSAWDEMDRLAYDYNQLAVELCHSEDQLREAAECVLLLIEYARKMHYRADPPWMFYDMPKWMQRRIEA